MFKISIKKTVFTLSGLAVIALIVMFGRTYEVSAEVKAGQTFGDWAVICEKEGKKDVCFLSQVLTSKEEAKDKNKKSEATVQRVAEFRVGSFVGPKDDSKDNSGVASDLKMIQVLPFGTSLQSGTSIILSKDKTTIAPAKFTTCQPFGCIAVVDLKGDINKLLTAEGDIFVGIMTIEGKQINIPLSTKGLKEGLVALKLTK